MFPFLFQIRNKVSLAGLHDKGIHLIYLSELKVVTQYTHTHLISFQFTLAIMILKSTVLQVKQLLLKSKQKVTRNLVNYYAWTGKKKLVSEQIQNLYAITELDCQIFFMKDNGFSQRCRWVLKLITPVFVLQLSIQSGPCYQDPEWPTFCHFWGSNSTISGKRKIFLQLDIQSLVFTLKDKSFHYQVIIMKNMLEIWYDVMELVLVLDLI